MPPKPLSLFSLVQSTSYPPIPGIEELEQLSNALKAQRTAANARLANMAPPEEERVVKKQKRKDREQTDERERAALAANQRAGAALEIVERRRIDTSADVKVKHERVSPAPSNASSASFRPNSQQPHGMPKKKKQKRVVDSDDEPLSQTPQPQAPGFKIKLQHNKGRPTESPAPPPAPPPTSGGNSNFDWTPPPQPQRPLVPPRPGVQKPFKPGPKRQNEVEEDFSDRKAPNQIACQTFWQNVEPYTRDIRHDDLALLTLKADQPDLFQMPPRGRHYTEIWDEEDGNAPFTTPRISVPPLFRPRPTRKATHAPQAPGEVDDIGAFSERLLSGVVGGIDLGEAFQRAVAGVPEPQDDPAPPPAPRVDGIDMEDKVKKEMRHMMLLGEHEEFDPAAREDDEITSALRRCQAELQAQMQLNDARRARLVTQAENRLAYNEYQAYLDHMDKFIETEWAKRVKKHGSTRKKQLVNGEVVGEGRPPVNPELMRVVRLREQWIKVVGSVLTTRPDGELQGIPTKSIYEGIGEGDKDGKAYAVDVDEADAEDE